MKYYRIGTRMGSIIGTVWHSYATSKKDALLQRMKLQQIGMTGVLIKQVG